MKLRTSFRGKLLLLTILPLAAAQVVTLLAVMKIVEKDVGRRARESLVIGGAVVNEFLTGRGEQLRASIAVAWARFCDHAAQHGKIQELQQRLEERKFIEQAKWIIVKRKGLSEPDAMRLLQKQARNNRRPLVEVARSILENESLFGVD